MPIIVENVSYTYLKKTPNSYRALKDVNFSINNGDFAGIIGKTGSGKSTVCQMFNGLLFPDSGDVFVDNISTSKLKKKSKTLKQLRKKVGLVFQFPEYQLFEETVEKDVAFGLLNFGSAKEEALSIAREYLLKVGIKEEQFKKSPFELSGGERRKVALAGILSINPDYLILDEPTAGLDPKSAHDIMTLISSLHDDGKTIVIITHDMHLLLKYCNKAIVLEDGNCIYEGQPIDLFLNENVTKGIEIPEVLKMTQKLSKKGVKLDYSLIKNTEDLVKEIKKWRSKNG